MGQGSYPLSMVLLMAYQDWQTGKLSLVLSEWAGWTQGRSLGSDHDALNRLRHAAACHCGPAAVSLGRKLMVVALDGRDEPLDNLWKPVQELLQLGSDVGVIVTYRDPQRHPSFSRSRQMAGDRVGLEVPLNEFWSREADGDDYSPLLDALQTVLGSRAMSLVIRLQEAIGTSNYLVPFGGTKPSPHWVNTDVLESLAQPRMLGAFAALVQDSLLAGEAVLFADPESLESRNALERLASIFWRDIMLKVGQRAPLGEESEAIFSDLLRTVARMTDPDRTFSKEVWYGWLAPRSIIFRKALAIIRQKWYTLLPE
jgi:hypothetical protein